MRFLHSRFFWLPFAMTAAVCGAFFAWEGGLLRAVIPSLLRPDLNSEEIAMSALLIFLLSLNMGLFVWQKKMGSCPAGIRRATGLGAIFGALTLICPACTILPITLIGTSLTLGFLAPFLPLFRLIALLILGVVTVMLWPKK